MSSNNLSIIPNDPEHVPPEVRQQQALALLMNLFPSALGFTTRENAIPEFVDASANTEAIFCPRCDAELELDWWGDAMDSAYKQDFANLEVTMPCCEVQTNLNDLRYVWPAGFARFVLAVESPGAILSDSDVTAIADSLGCPVRAIWARI